MKQVENMVERKISWKSFQRYFKCEYLSHQYYDKKMSEFVELKLGSMTMEEYAKRFMELLSYVEFI